MISMRKPELLVTPTKLSDIPLLAEAGATAVIVGERQFGLRLGGEFSREDVKEAIEIGHVHRLKVYVAINGIFHNEKLELLTDYMKYIASLDVDGFVFGDPSVVLLAREVAPHVKLHWNTETTATNWFTCNYWGEKGAKRAVLARELNMEAIIETKEHAKVEIEVQIHGMTAMFQSRRSLIGNYFEYQGKSMDIMKSKYDKNLFLFDKERGSRYPIFEDCNGTHIMSPNDICMIDDLEELIDAGVDSLKIDGVLKSTEYLVEVTKYYAQAIELCVNNRQKYEEIKGELSKEIEALQPANRPLDTGFFYKETVY